jgi:hypothetical protein
MLGAVMLVVGAIFAWIVADYLLVWMKERRQGGPSPWYGHGPGATFHSTGFEDTLPPHEAAERLSHGRRVRQPPSTRSDAMPGRMRGS